MLKRLSLAAFAIWLGALWWLSSGPRDVPMGAEIPFADKICHFGYFGLGGLLLGTALALRTPGTRAAILAGVLLMALIGASDEFHQTMVPGRSGNDPADWTADTLGGACGIIAGVWLQHRRARSQES